MHRCNFPINRKAAAIRIPAPKGALCIIQRQLTMTESPMRNDLACFISVGSALDAS